MKCDKSFQKNNMTNQNEVSEKNGRYSANDHDIPWESNGVASGYHIIRGAEHQSFLSYMKKTGEHQRKFENVFNKIQGVQRDLSKVKVSSECFEGKFSRFIYWNELLPSKNLQLYMKV